MLQIDLVCVGKIKESFYRDAIAEYIKRLSRYAKVEIREAEDEKTPDKASEKEEEQIKKREGERILKLIRDHSYVIALAIDGRAYDSPSLAAHLDQLAASGAGRLAFVIGGSLGLSKEVLSRADEKISFSALTFPHQLMRVILLEQIYRAHKILRREPYHK